jgi:threonine/homoserine/homoserine lactone efflux protein
MAYILSVLFGLLVGILITVPLGPTSIYVAQRTLNGETRKGLHVAFGAVLVDVLYCLVITMGLISLISPYIQNPVVQIIFSVFLIAYGVKMLVFDRRKSLEDEEQEEQRLLTKGARFERGHYYVLLGVSMTMANPTLFFSWVAVLSFVTAHGLLVSEFWHKLIFSISAGLGSMLWFFVLAFFVRSKRHMISPSFVRRAGAVTALVIIGFGVYFTITIVQHLNGSV